MAAPVLVVDDNPLNQRLLEVILTAEGYAVVTAANAEAALRLIASAAPRAILMDLQMPGVNGYELTRRLKAGPETAAIPVIAVTAAAMRGDEERAREVGCDGYVSKPIDRVRLTQMLQALLHES